MDKDDIAKERQEVIDEFFGGSETAYMSSVNSNMKQATSWKIILAGMMVFPELKDAALKLIEDFLGYLPRAKHILPDEEFLRILIHQFHHGQIGQDKFIEEAELHIKAIRNRQFLYVTKEAFQQKLPKEYETNLPELKEKARQRLIKFSRYVPDLNVSMNSEIILRLAIADESVHLDENILTSYDMIALTGLKYMEALLVGGKEAADASPLVFLDFKIMNEHPYLSD